jgi:hypothetical protein
MSMGGLYITTSTTQWMELEPPHDQGLGYYPLLVTPLGIDVILRASTPLGCSRKHF